MVKPVITKHAIDKFHELIINGPTNKIKGAILHSIRTSSYLDSRIDPNGIKDDYYLGSYFVKGGKNKAFVTVLRGDLVLDILKPDCPKLKDDVTEYKANVDHVRTGKALSNKTVRDMEAKIRRLQQDNNRLNKVLADKEAIIKHCEHLDCRIIKIFGKEIIVM